MSRVNCTARGREGAEKRAHTKNLRLNSGVAAATLASSFARASAACSAFSRCRIPSAITIAHAARQANYGRARSQKQGRTLGLAHVSQLLREHLALRLPVPGLSLERRRLLFQLAHRILTRLQRNGIRRTGFNTQLRTKRGEQRGSTLSSAASFCTAAGDAAAAAADADDEAAAAAELGVRGEAAAAAAAAC